MANDADASDIYKQSNINPVEDYQKALTAGVDRQVQGIKLSQLANQATTANQQFSDEQLQRKALQQNVDSQGNVNIPGAVAQVAQQNPAMAQMLHKALNQFGIDGANQHAERMQQFFSNTTPESYQADKQKLIDSGFDEAKQLPPEYLSSVMQKGLIASSTAAQKLEMIKNQASQQFQRDTELLKQHIVPPDSSGNLYNIYGSDKSSGQEANPHLTSSKYLPPQAQGLKPGDVIPAAPGDERDVKGIAAANASLGAKIQNNQDYSQAQANMGRVGRLEELYNKYKGKDGKIDFNKVNTQDQHLIATEVASAAKGGGAPTEDEVNALLPHSGSAYYANKKSDVTNKPEPMNAGEHFKGLYDYAQDIKGKALNTIQAVHNDAAKDGVLEGASPQSIAKWKASKVQELTQRAYGQNKLMAPAEKPSADAIKYYQMHKDIPGMTQEKASEIISNRLRGQ